MVEVIRYTSEFEPADESSQVASTWERWRAGRPIRWWRVYVDIFTSAVDEDDAIDRLADRQRQLYHYSSGIPCWATDLGLAMPEPLTDDGYEVSELSSADLSDRQRALLVADYPPVAWDLHHTSPDLWLEGVRAGIHLVDYAESLELAAARLERKNLTGPQQRLASRPSLPKETPLRFWRAQRRTDVLAGLDRNSANRRGRQLAATVVDRQGRPAGRLAAVEPNDGARSWLTNRWKPPHQWSNCVAALCADYDAHQHVTDYDVAQAAILRHAAAQLLIPHVPPTASQPPRPLG